MENVLRIGTWNLAGKWTADHRDLLASQNCDVWLLTEVKPDSTINGYHLNLSTAFMASDKHWAGILSRQPTSLVPEPHEASVAAKLDGVTYFSSILPWRSCGSELPWSSGSQAEKTAKALEKVRDGLPRSELVWGGDWNHALVGPERAGSLAGRESILALLDELSLNVPTTFLQHRLGECTIDHVAVPRSWGIQGAWRVPVENRLSDHDAYAIEVITRPRKAVIGGE